MGGKRESERVKEGGLKREGTKGNLVFGGEKTKKINFLREVLAHFCFLSAKILLN